MMKNLTDPKLLHISVFYLFYRGDEMSTFHILVLQMLLIFLLKVDTSLLDILLNK